MRGISWSSLVRMTGGGWLVALLIVLGNILLGGGLAIKNAVYPFSSFALFNITSVHPDSRHEYVLLTDDGRDVTSARLLKIPTAHYALIFNGLLREAGAAIERGESATSTLQRMFEILRLDVDQVSLYRDDRSPVEAYWGDRSKQTLLLTVSRSDL